MALEAGIRHYARARHTGATTGQGNWGEVTQFVTKVPFPNTEEAILTASDCAASAFFGQVCSITSDGSRVAIASTMIASSGINQAGQVYIYYYNGTSWIEEAILSASDKAASDFFGTSIALSKDGAYIVIGATGVDIAGSQGVGKVYTFVRTGTTWTQESMMIPSDWIPGLLFGSSVALSHDNTRLVVGARGGAPGLS